MKLAFAPLLLAALLPSAALAAPAKGPPQICPHLARDFARKADLPAGVLALLVPMAERGGRFRVADVIRPDEHNLPAARFISARQRGCTLSVRYEYGGIAHGFATALLELRGARWMLLRAR